MIRVPVESLKLDDWSAGFGTKVSITGYPPNVSPDCLNICSRLLKSLNKRKGYTMQGSTTTTIDYMEYSTDALVRQNYPSSDEETFVLAYDSGELSSAVTSITISGLDGDTDEEWKLILRAVAGSSTETAFRLRPNNDSGVNYGYQYLRGTLTTVAAAQSTTETGLVGGWSASPNSISFNSWHLYTKSGYVRTALLEDADNISGTTVNNLLLWGESWNNTSSNITSLVLVGSLTNSLGIGSRIILLKKSAGPSVFQSAYETTLTSAATSVTISSLDGNTDVMWELRVRSRDASAGASGLVRFNNDSGTNYGQQAVRGYSTTIEAYRGTSYTGHYVTEGGGTNYLSMCEMLIYAKSGYVRTSLGKYTTGIAGTTIYDINKVGYSWNNIADNITSLVLFNDVTNGFGIGTYIKLNKLVL